MTLLVSLLITQDPFQLHLFFPVLESPRRSAVIVNDQSHQAIETQFGMDIWGERLILRGGGWVTYIAEITPIDQVFC